jgi:RHS repeat-associated protein
MFMKLAKLALAVVVSMAGNISLVGQTQPNSSNGIPPQGSYDASSIDTVNLVNGNLTLHIPLPFDYPQRGKLGIKYYLIVNAKTWLAGGDPNTMTGQWSPTSACGNVPASNAPCGQGPVFVSTASFAMTRIWQSVFQDGVGTSYSATDPDSLVTWDGSSHSLAGTTYDTSGYRVVMSGDDGNGVPNTATIIDRNGTQYIGGFFGGDCSTDPGNGLPGSIQTTTCLQHFSLGSVVDANGNILSSPVPIPSIDTNGSPSILAHAAVGSESVGCLTSFGTPWVYYFNYPAPNGQTNQIKLCFGPYPQLATSFSQPGVHQFQDVYSGHPFPGNWRPPVYLTSVILPDNTQWSISYDSYGEITSVATPTGASIQYAWGEGSFPRCNVAGNDITLVSRAVQSRTVTDVNGHTFTWSYQWTPQAGDGTLSHTVTDPNGNDTAHVFVDLTAAWNPPICDFRETRTTSYQGTGGSRTTLQQADTTWLMKKDGGLGVPSDVTTTLFPSQKVSLEHTDYDPSSPTLGLVTSKKIYDRGQGVPGSLLREDDIVYQWQKDSRYLTANLIDLLASSVVVSPVVASNTKPSCPVDGIGTVKACMEETDYTYDEAAYLTNYESTVGALPAGSHDAAPSPVRGNPTTITKYLSTGGSVLSHSNWYDTGMIYRETDPLGHFTTHSYDLAYKGILPTKTCNAKNQCVSATYDINTGLLASFTDENGSYPANGTTQGDPAHTSTYSYDLMSRITSSILPADPQGQHPQTTFSYPNSATVQKVQAITSVLSDSVTTHGDGLGHIVRTEHVTPAGTALLDTTYDGLGHVKTKTNPYYTLSDATYGVIQTSYDGMGRSTSVAEQDGSVKTVDYSIGNCSVATDEAGKQRRLCSDALGRLVEVDEPNPGSQAIPAQGTLTINGTLKSQSGVGAINAASGTGSLTITGSERSITTGGDSYCAFWNNEGSCVDWEINPTVTTYDSGTVTITVNGHPNSVSYDSSSSSVNIATALATVINGDAGGFVNASASNGVLSLTARQTGASTNYSWSISSSSSDPTDFGAAGSFSGSPTSGAMTGGANGSGGTTVTDYGTVTITVGGFTASACYGANPATACNGINNSSAAQVAAAIAGNGPTGLSRSGSPVNAVPSGAGITITYNTAGTAGNGAAITSTSQSTQTQWTFSPASFTAAGTTLANGMNAGDFNNNPYVTLYQYDALGNLLRVDQKGSAPSDSTQWRTRTFTYDSLSRLLTATNPESGTIAYSYDADGELLMKTSPAPNQTGSTTQTISYCYDELHRPTKRDYLTHTFSPPACPITAPVVTYAYDSGANAAGHMTSLTDQAGTATFTFDILGRLGTETRTLTGANNGVISKGVSYGYNLDNSPKTLTYPSGATVTYAPWQSGTIAVSVPGSAIDSGNGINYVTGAGGLGTYASYGPNLAITGYLTGKSGTFAGITNAFSYNKRLQPLAVSATAPSQTVFSIGYDFHVGNGTTGSDNGNVFGITNYKDTTRNQTFAYDALSRLTSAQNAGTDCTVNVLGGNKKFWGNAYSYDAWANLVSKSVTKCSAENLSVVAGNNNRLTGAYLYDAVGNMTHDATNGLNYTFDQENRLTGSAGYAYTYDGNGNRVRRSNGNLAANGTLYWYMTPGVVAETDLAGTLKSEYIFFDGERVARRDGPTGAGGVFYYFSDSLKTASVIADSAGVIKAESDYYPWGGELQFVNNDSNDYKFTGKKRDSETALHYFGARYYGSGLGRFVTPDQPFADQDEGDPQSWNLYAYAGNNPLRYVDPDGQSHVDKDGYTVGDYPGECINGGSLCWDAKNQRWDKPQPRMDNGAVTPGFLGPFDIFFFGRLPGGSAASTAEKAAARLAAEAAAKAAAEAAAKAAAEAALKKEVTELLGKAASTVGNQGVQATSRQAAEQAAKEWVGQGAQPILAGRGTGQIIGEVSADGSKVARFTSAGKASPYINLENKATGGNLHIHF